MTSQEVRDGRAGEFEAFCLRQNAALIMNAGGTNQVNLTDSPNVEFGTAFSPDGTQIAFAGTGGPVPTGQRYVRPSAPTDPAVVPWPQPQDFAKQHPVAPLGSNR